MDHEALIALSTKITSTIGGLAIIWTMFRQLIPYQLINHHLLALTIKLTSYLNPYESFISRHELYVAAKAYLSDHCSRRAYTCHVELGMNNDRFMVSINDKVEVMDDFNGAIPLLEF